MLTHTCAPLVNIHGSGYRGPAGVGGTAAQADLRHRPWDGVEESSGEAVPSPHTKPRALHGQVSPLQHSVSGVQPLPRKTWGSQVCRGWCQVLSSVQQCLETGEAGHAPWPCVSLVSLSYGVEVGDFLKLVNTGCWQNFLKNRGLFILPERHECKRGTEGAWKYSPLATPQLPWLITGQQSIPGTKCPVSKRSCNSLGLP